MHIKTVGGKPMHRECIYHLNGEFLIGGLGEGTVNNILQLAAGGHHPTDGGIAL